MKKHIKYWLKIKNPSNFETFDMTETQKEQLKEYDKKLLEMGFKINLVEPSNYLFTTFYEKQAKDIFTRVLKLKLKYQENLSFLFELVTCAIQPYCPKCFLRGKFSHKKCIDCGTKLIPKEIVVFGR